LWHDIAPTKQSNKDRKGEEYAGDIFNSMPINQGTKYPPQTLEHELVRPNSNKTFVTCSVKGEAQRGPRVNLRSIKYAQKKTPLRKENLAGETESGQNWGGRQG
jgi:hypothetical protein